MRKFSVLALALLFTAGLFFSLEGVSQASRPSAKRLYTKATARMAGLAKNPRKRRLRSGWERSIADFDRIIRRYPGSTYAGNSAYYKAAAYAGMYKYSQVDADLQSAVDNYKEFLAKYPKNQYAGQARSRLKALARDLPAETPSPAAPTDVTEEAEPSPPAAVPVSAPPAPAPAAVSVPETRLARVTGIRHWSNAGDTRVIIDIDGAATYKKRTLKNPDRLFFDIKRASIQAPLKDGIIQVNDGIIKDIRASRHDPETVRVVLDIERISSHHTVMLSNPARLVIDVSGAVKHAKRGRCRLITLRSAEGERPSDAPAQTAPPAVAATENPAASPANPPPPVPAFADTSSATAAQLKTPAPGATEPVVETRQGPPKPSACIACIVIDPGHGGHDSGAVGPTGLEEKDVVLDIGIRLRDIVQREIGCRTIMTRDSDVFIDLDARPMIAAQQDADIFISIHANASRDKRARGIETYLLNTTKDRNIMELAASENMMSVDKMSDLYTILKDLALVPKRDESIHLAHAVQARLVGDLNGYKGAVNDKGVMQGPFLVLYGASMPSILTEVGFISNPEEEDLLATPEYRQKVAEAIFDGIKDYVSNAGVVAARGPSANPKVTP